MKKNAIFIAATGQNIGKTTLCLGILSGLKKRLSSVGFIKPVGQQHMTIEGNVTVDKDVVLFKNTFQLTSSWTDMSPVIIPPGFTKDFIDGKITEKEMVAKITRAFETISKTHAYTIVEGTGHLGVGSIINLSNAKVAALLDVPMVIIASGGLGSAYDELSLNLALCHAQGARVRGVILNRVYADKKEMILHYFPKLLEKWRIPLIGCIPYNEFLNNPTIKDFENLFETTIFSGEQYRFRHFGHTRLAASSLDAYEEDVIQNELVITPASREDIIQSVLKRHLIASKVDGTDFQGGMILTGRHPPSAEITEQIRKVDIPTLYAPMHSYEAMKMITSYIAKIRMEDLPKVEKAISLVEENLNFDLLCNA
ncbi:MAG: cobyrinic acid a,c-diamide synthase [Parachlamydia sp.]|nr:MAG: cobyrinic acid a,c-diamide synthase [Parachlamydia sp.]